LRRGVRVIPYRRKLASKRALFLYRGLDGGQLYGIPAVDAAGNVYGSAFWGGDANRGVVWEVSPSSGGWQETVLHSFHGYGDDGAFPSSSVILHNGIVFGGSPLNIFEIKP
jgi:hypothetical protein